MISRLQEKHALMTRWTHWINFPVLAVMVWSGLLIYWANDVSAIRFWGVTIFKFFPAWFYQALHVDHRLRRARRQHDIAHSEIAQVLQPLIARQRHREADG